jgi:hypothetical protein
MKKGICFLYFDGEMIERKPFKNRSNMRDILTAFKKRVKPFEFSHFIYVSIIFNQ